MGDGEGEGGGHQVDGVHQGQGQQQPGEYELFSNKVKYGESLVVWTGFCQEHRSRMNW